MLIKLIFPPFLSKNKNNISQSSASDSEQESGNQKSKAKMKGPRARVQPRPVASKKSSDSEAENKSTTKQPGNYFIKLVIFCIQVIVYFVAARKLTRSSSARMRKSKHVLGKNVSDSESESFLHSDGPLCDSTPTHDSQTSDHSTETTVGLPLTSIPSSASSSWEELYDFESTFDRPLRHFATRSAPSSGLASCLKNCKRPRRSRRLHVSWRTSPVSFKGVKDDILTERYLLSPDMLQ